MKAKKLGRIFGFVGSIASLAPGLILTIYYVVILLLPDEGHHFMSKGNAAGFLVFVMPYSLIPAIGLVSSFFAREQAKAAGIMMLASAMLMLYTVSNRQWFLYPAPILLAVGGVLTLIGAVKQKNTQNKSPDSDQP